MVQISYSEPLKRAYGHMVEMLFRPFDLGRWFVIGFSGWLAQFLGCSGGGGSGANLGIPPSGRGGGSGERESAVIRDLLEGRVGIGSDIERFFARMRDVLEEPAAVLFAGCGVTAILGLFVLLVVVVLVLLWAHFHMIRRQGISGGL